MSVLMVNAKIKEEHVEAVEAAVEQLFGAIEKAQPGNVRYASCKTADTSEFVVLLELSEGTENPLPLLPEFQEFQNGLSGWVDGPPSVDQLRVVGSYRMFD